MSPDLKLVMTGTFFSIGALFLFLAARKSKKRRQLEARCTAPAEATVVDVYSVEHYDQETHRTSVEWFPLLTYHADGQSVTKGSLYGHAFRRHYRVGQTLSVYYNPLSAEEFYIPSELGRFTESVAYIVVAVLMFIFGIFIPAKWG